MRACRALERDDQAGHVSAKRDIASTHHHRAQRFFFFTSRSMNVIENSFLRRDSVNLLRTSTTYLVRMTPTTAKNCASTNSDADMISHCGSGAVSGRCGMQWRRTLALVVVGLHVRERVDEDGAEVQHAGAAERIHDPGTVSVDVTRKRSHSLMRWRRC